MAGQQPFTAIREQYLEMTPQQKRKFYDKYQTVCDVPTWETYYRLNKTRIEDGGILGKKRKSMLYPENTKINQKVSLWKGNIVELEIDAIVNPANNTLTGGGTVFKAISAAAGPDMQVECKILGAECVAGDTKLGGGYKLPAKYVIHAVSGSKEDNLTSCYSGCLEIAHVNNLTTIAFPCVSVGAAGYSHEKAAKIALKTVREWLQKDEAADMVKRVIFCVYANTDIKIYEKQMQKYFPVDAEAGPPETQSTDVDTEQPTNIDGVRVDGIPAGILGKPVTFNVDARNAGKGFLSVKVNGQSTKPTVWVTATAPKRYQVQFVPTEFTPHNITIEFNQIFHPGSPFRCVVSAEHSLAWDAPRLLTIAEPTVFEVTTNNMIEPYILPEVDVKISDASGKDVAVKGHRLKHKQQIHFTPDTHGKYEITVKVGGNNIPGSPFTCFAEEFSIPAKASAVTRVPSAIHRMEKAPTNPKIGKFLGKGAFGKVYLCYDPDTGRELAVKKIPIDKRMDSKVIDKMRKEVDLLSSLHHERVVQFVGSYEAGEMLSIYMEYVPGGSVADQISEYGPLTEKVASKYTRQILEGLCYLHELNVIHRDIKGGNLLREPSANIKLSDFGCSKEMKVNVDNTIGIGTLYWMSPDILKDGGYDNKTDIWSVGCTIVEMITGKAPWQDIKSIGLLVEEILNADHPHYKLPKNASGHMKDFLNLCFRREANRRPAGRKLLTHPFTQE